MFPTMGKEMFAAEIGVSPGTVDGWIKRDWTKGVEYVVKGHTTLINIEKVTLWLHGLLESDREAQESLSEYGDTESSPIQKRSRVTPTRKLTSPVRFGVVPS